MDFDRPTRAVLGGALRDEHIRPYVGDGDVVLRVVRPLPDVAGPGRVQDGLTSQVAADPTRHRLDVIDRGDHGGVVVDVRLCCDALGHGHSLTSLAGGCTL